jgi:hypothetical protein
MGGIAASLAERAPSQTACAVRAATPEEMRAWAKAARAGERFVYLTGPQLNEGPAVRAARALRAQGLVEFVSLRRADCAGFDWMIERLPSAGARRQPPLAVRDAAAAKILRVLRTAAANGRPCPSWGQLARIGGLPTREAARRRVARLIEEGKIQCATIDGPMGPERVVTLPERRPRRS